MKRLAFGAVLLTTSCGLGLQDLPLGAGGSGYQVTAVFSDVGRLPMGGAVRLGQAVVGRVSGISTEDFHALVELDLDPGVRLPAGTTARLELSSPLGEEFVVLLPETDSQGGERVAERLCAAIRNTPFRPDSGYRAGNPLSINVTVSIGIAVFPLHGRTGEEVLEAADDALYAAKAAGRNTWRVARTCDPIPPADTTRSCDSATDTPVKESVEDVPVGAPADTSVKALPRTRTPSDSSERP